MKVFGKVDEFVTSGIVAHLLTEAEGHQLANHIWRYSVFLDRLSISVLGEELSAFYMCSVERFVRNNLLAEAQDMPSLVRLRLQSFPEVDSLRCSVPITFPHDLFVHYNHPFLVKSLSFHPLLLQ